MLYMMALLVLSERGLFVDIEHRHLSEVYSTGIMAWAAHILRLHINIYRRMMTNNNIYIHTLGCLKCLLSHERFPASTSLSPITIPLWQVVAWTLVADWCIGVGWPESHSPPPVLAIHSPE